MPKRSKTRKLNPSRQTGIPVSSASPTSIRRQKIVKYAAIALVIALVSTFLIGALASSPAGASERVSSVPAVEPAETPAADPDTDGDGVINNADEDIDGDGVVNGIDEDIDGDGQSNEQDGDPAATNGVVDSAPETTSTFELPRLIPAEFETPAGRAAIAVLILVAGAAVIWARRKNK
ncbi:MAG: hypothetical protein RL645_233 [Actinomycetota bacterium]|jgi:hypothetical protein